VGEREAVVAHEQHQGVFGEAAVHARDFVGVAAQVFAHAGQVRQEGGNGEALAVVRRAGAR
jgi:hypothetical protein